MCGSGAGGGSGGEGVLSVCVFVRHLLVCLFVVCLFVPGGRRQTHRQKKRRISKYRERDRGRDKQRQTNT